MISMPCRIEILSCHQLKPEHFDSMDKALEAADVMVAGLKENNPDLHEAYPDIVVPGVPLLDQFYYWKTEGTLAALEISHAHIETIMRDSLRHENVLPQFMGFGPHTR